MFILKSRIFHAMFLGVTVLIVSGCITMEGLQKKYDGYTVVSKERKETTEEVPTWILSCVQPNGAVKCEVQAVGSYPSPGVNACARSCNGKEGDRWGKTQTGTQKQTNFKYILQLRSPAGKVVEEQITPSIFDQVSEGQVFSTKSK